MADYYATGTVSVSNGSTTVTGSGVVWSTVFAGDTLELAGQRVTIASAPVSPYSSLTLAAAWTGTTQSGASYVIRYDAPSRFTVSYLATQVRAFVDKTAIIEAAAPTYSVLAVTNTPPGSPVANDTYALGASPTGAWSGNAGKLAQWTGSAWSFTTPEGGWLAYAVGDRLYAYDSGWFPASDMTAATYDPNSVEADAFDSANHAFDPTGTSLTSTDVQAAIAEGLAASKHSFSNAGTELSSTTVQAAIAELDDDLATERAARREKLTTARTYYVRSDGSDSNTGLVNSSGGAFLTIQKAIDVVVGTLDLGGNNVTISVGSGTFAGLSMTSRQTGAGDITVQGDLTTPSNVTVGAILVSGAGCRLFVGGMNIDKGTGSYCLRADTGGFVRATGLMRYSSTSGGHRIISDKGGVIEVRANEQIAGTVAGAHYLAISNGIIDCTAANTWTAVSTPEQTGAFAWALAGGIISAASNVTSGSFTGPRYLASLNGVINANGGGASLFPGSTAGSTATGGQYA